MQPCERWFHKALGSSFSIPLAACALRPPRWPSMAAALATKNPFHFSRPLCLTRVNLHAATEAFTVYRVD
eukprot:scaffold211686_cov33-Tisochrysis_lutea.AAC.2